MTTKTDLDRLQEVDAKLVAQAAAMSSPADVPQLVGRIVTPSDLYAFDRPERMLANTILLINAMPSVGLMAGAMRALWSDGFLVGATFQSTVFAERLIEEAAGLLEPGREFANPEYLRGMAELIGRVTGLTTADTSDTIKRITEAVR